jgi:hypothetical protein
MDLEDPAANLSYTDTHEELRYYGIKDAIDIHTCSLGQLAMLGSLGPDRAGRLHQFIRERFLKPLGLLEARRGNDEASIEVLGAEGSAEEAALEGVNVEDRAVEGGEVVNATAEDGWAVSFARLTTEGSSDLSSLAPHPAISSP